MDSASESHVELAERHSVPEQAVRRMRRVLSSGAPAIPWGDWEAVAAWYARYYRSDGVVRQSGSAPLPDWLKAKIARPVNPPAVKADEPLDVLAENDRALERVRALAAANPDNPEIQRQFRDALDAHSQTRKRILQSSGDYFQAGKVEAWITAIHARIPDALERDLKALYPEARKAVESLDAWHSFCERALEAIRRRLVESKFTV